MNDSSYATVVEPGAVRLERLLPGPIERIWLYLIDSDKRKSWLASGPLEENAGGKVAHHFANNSLTGHDDPPPAKFGDGTCDFEGVVLACEPPRLLRYSWMLDTEVCFELEEQGDRVKFTVTHRRLQDEIVIGVATGWHTHLAVLAARLDAVPPPSFWLLFSRLEADYTQRLGG